MQYLLNRPMPSMDPRFYKTYSMGAPLKTHWRPATCEEYECNEFLKGFVITIDMTSELGQRQFAYLSKDKTRSGHMQRVSLELVKFVYGPGNRCFNWGKHIVPIGRPPLLIARGGDWRGNPERRRRVHTRVEDWVEDSATHLDRLDRIVRRG
jgi:hypothetical protein